MQLWMWQFEDSTEVETFAMTRIITGNIPSTNISIVAIKETTILNGNDRKYPDAKEALQRNSYVDNVMTTAKNHSLLDAKIKEIEHVAGLGGFKFKPWVVSGSDSPDLTFGPATEDSETGDVIEKALGIQWLVSKDLLRIKPDVSYRGNKRKGKPIPLKDHLDDIQKLIPLKLCLKDCLSVHAKCYDPLGLVLAVKMVGNLLFRDTLQKMKLEAASNVIPWDQVVPESLLEDWLRYFKMLEALKDITFNRSVKPENVNEDILPDLITIGDGNKMAFGAIAYALWTLLDSTKKATLLMAKAKLGPLVFKGDVIKCEMSSAVYQARLKIFIQQESGIQFAEHIPFLDSQIVQYMIRKDSYIYNTFFGLRVAEIQRKTEVDKWNHIPSEYSVADLLTKGTTPDKIGPDSEWQNGPKFLTQDRSLWPITTPNLSNEDKSKVTEFVSKSKTHDFSGQIYMMQTQKVNTVNPFDSVLDKSSSL